MPRPDHPRSDAVPATVQETPTGRYLHDIELPPSLHPAFPALPPSSLGYPEAEPPRCIASKSRPTEDDPPLIRLGLYPPIQPLSRPEVEHFLVPAAAVIFTSVRP